MFVGNYKLDNEQEEIVCDNNKYLLVVAGAGAGKTLTILGKINYLINTLNYKENDILCISYTKDASLSLKNKIKKEFNLDIDVYTFHKLGVEILKSYNINFNITDTDTLERCIYNYLYIDCINNIKQLKYVCKYLKVKIKDKNKFYKYLNNNNDYILKKFELISTFIKLFKSNNFNINDYSTFFKKIKKYIFKYNYFKIFLLISLNIYLKYEKELEINKEIDFDDLIIKSRELVNKYGIKKKYKFIIIDEYQDSSFIRFSLIKSILLYCDAKLMVVGDDWQSIYRFSGCTLDLFVNFKNYFPNSKILKINTTYRNSIELTNIAGKFIMKNNLQIKKNLKSNKSLDYPIRIIYYKNIKNDFIKLIDYLYKNFGNDILVLGRNNKDINILLNDKIKLKDKKIIINDIKDIDITYLTIHRSKGLESNNVIIINLNNDICGLPSKIKEDKILSLVNNNTEKYLYGEERRLFYVALTRTKNYCYLLVNKKTESIFIKELVRDFKDKIKLYYIK